MSGASSIRFGCVRVQPLAAGNYRTAGADDAAELAGVGDAVKLPVGLDPQQLPIIAAHFYNWRPVGDVGRATTAVTSDQDCEVFACPT